MKIKKLFLVLLLSLFAITCGKKDDDVVKIGILTPLTGDVASWGKIQQNATQIALDQINSEGGINGHKVDVIYEDDKASPKEGLTAFKKLYDVDKVSIVIGCPASNVTLAIASVANQMKKVLLSSGSTAQEVGNAGPYVFRIMPSDEVQSKIMADWAIQLGYKKIAIIYVENSWGQGLMEEFKKNFVQKGGEIILLESSKQDASDFRDQLIKIKKENPDAIYAPLHTRNAGLMIRQAREIGMKQQILGADVYNTPDLIAAGGDAVDGVLYTTFSEGEGDIYKKFAGEYKKRYGIEPETYAIYCYDTFLVAIETLKNLKDLEIKGETVRESLLKIKNFSGATGITTFDGKNSALGKTFEKWTVKNGVHIKY